MRPRTLLGLGALAFGLLASRTVTITAGPVAEPDRPWIKESWKAFRRSRGKSSTHAFHRHGKGKSREGRYLRKGLRP